MNDFVSALFYFGFGFFFCLFIGVLRSKKKSHDSSDESHDNITGSVPRFYINVFLTNRKEVLENIVRKKVSRKRRVLRAVAKRLAVNLVSDEVLIGKIATDLITIIPFKLSLIGVRATASLAYKQSAFICIEVELPSVDIVKLTEVNGGVEAGAKVSQMLQFIGMPAVTNLIETYAAKLIFYRIMNQLPQTIQEKLEDKLVAEVDIVSLTEEEQGPFLIQTIQQLNDSKSSSSSSNSATSTSITTSTSND